MRLDPAAIRRQIEILLTAYPELADDEVLRLDMIEGSTDMIEFMRALEVARQGASATADAVGALIDNWRQRMARFQKRDEAIRALMFKLLQLAHLKKLELPEATISLKIGVPKVRHHRRGRAAGRVLPHQARAGQGQDQAGAVRFQGGARRHAE